MTRCQPGLLSCSLFCSFLVLTACVFGEDETSPDLTTAPGLTSKDCSFNVNPGRFLDARSQVQKDIFERTSKIGALRYSSAQRQDLAAGNSIPHNNFIDDEIFGKLAQMNVAPARLATDEEFIRRITLDLTGRIPSADDIRAFEADTNPTKRADTIDKLLNSPEFTDKYTMYFGDLLQNTAGTLSTSNVSRNFDGRNAFYRYLKGAIGSNKSIHDLAWEVIAFTGNNYSDEGAMVNFMAGAQTAGGPVQDTYDMAMVKSVTAFLGIGHYDCLGCHNGRGHLDQLSLYAKNHARVDAWGMSAFFARVRISVDNQNRAARQYTDPLYGSTNITDATAGTYDLNVTYGNRPARCKDNLTPDDKGHCMATASLTPVYRDGSKPADGNWRQAFASFITADPMFAKNMVNRIWKQYFNMGLVDPVDTLDPDRLDSKNPPPDPWTFQATHPVLLDKLADSFSGSYYSLRELVRTIVSSNAYQLSSRYDGNWNIDYVPLFARHYPRRLDAEEVHDAVAKATGVPGKYTIQATSFRASPTDAFAMLPDPVLWAMQLPDTSEPRNNGGNSSGFMNPFLRGNRDTLARNSAGSILQQLTLMNDAFVNTRTKMGASPTLQTIAKLSGNDAIVNEIFLTFLSRLPSDSEKSIALKTLQQATTPAAKSTAIEDLSWAAINKVDFLFSY